MNFKLSLTEEKEWPPLGWIAELIDGDSIVRVRHGSEVEARDSWMCEAVWAGDFNAGDFDRTDLVFGSGIRVRDGEVIFVSSATTVDRLQFLQLPGRTLISNSLACLVAVGAVAVDPQFTAYRELLTSIVSGIDSYARSLPTLSPHVELVYFRNLSWDGAHLAERAKPAFVRDFGTFGKYYEFLAGSVAAIAENMRSPARAFPYEMLGTLSSGYDSTTAAALCRAHGMRQAISFVTARGGESDHGKDVADVLGLDLTLVERHAWRADELAEVPYLAATGSGVDVIFEGAAALMHRRVLITGFHGDKVWAKDTKALGPDIVRGDASGLSFCERRLSLGCIHFPIAFLGVRQIRDIVALSNSPDLAPWDVPGEYSRPICRRIAEDAHVDRKLFGVNKKAATVLFLRGESMVTPRTRAVYYEWLRQRSATSDRRLTGGPRGPGRWLLALHERYYLLAQFARFISRPLPLPARDWIENRVTAFHRDLNRKINLMPYIFPWAIDHWAKRYSKTTPQSHGAAGG